MICPVLFILVSCIPSLISGNCLWASIFVGMNQYMLAYLTSVIPILLIPFVVLLGVAGAVGLKLYKLTGRVWLGALVNSMLICMITVANTSFTYAY